jgi:hypothetical protein
MTQLKVTGTYKVVLELHYDWLYYIADKSSVIIFCDLVLREIKVKYVAVIQIHG